MSDSQRSGGDSTGSHPVINTVGLANGRWFADWVRVENNVIRKRDSATLGAIPVIGMQNAGTPDHKRNYEYLGNKYEIHSNIPNPFRWDGSYINFSTWKTKRAASGNVQNTGPFFDATGQFVTWSGSKQFADTTCGWENG